MSECYAGAPASGCQGLSEVAGGLVISGQDENQLPQSVQSCPTLGGNWTFANITQNGYIYCNANASIYWGGEREPLFLLENPIFSI